MKQDQEHNNNFNLLRFIFASMVIVSHAPELKYGNRDSEILTQIFGTISFGELAVDSFFIISGYLIMKSWITKPNFSAFLLSRFLRIFPGFAVASLICALVVAPMYGSTTYFNDFSTLKYIKSLATLHQPKIPEVFSGTYYPKINGSMWSISFEFSCYMLVLACGVIGLLRKRQIWAGISLIFVAMYILDRTGAFSLGEAARHVRCGMAFSIGGCFYLFKDNIPWSMKIMAPALVGFFTLLFCDAIAEVAASILWGYVIIYYANTGKSLLAFNKLPDVSYGIYLYAWPINKILLWHYPQMNQYTSIVAVLTLSIGAGILSWYSVEKPSLRIKKHAMSKWQSFRQAINY